MSFGSKFTALKKVLATLLELFGTRGIVPPLPPLALPLSRVHARQVQKSFNFNHSVWMNTFCHTVSCMLSICAVEQTM